MTDLQLSKFINEQNIEYHWNDDDVIIFVSHYQIKDFMDLLGPRYLMDKEVECVLRYGYICLYMGVICDDFNIDIKDIFPKLELY